MNFIHTSFFISLSLFLSILFWTSACNSEDFAHRQTNKIVHEEKNLNITMAEIARITADAFPLIYSARNLSRQENETLINTVNHLQSLFKKTEPYFQSRSPTYQMSYELLQDYLSGITENNEAHLLPEIKSHLLALSDFCISCHTQDREVRTLFSSGLDRNKDALISSSSHRVKAEFNYATRNYLEAHKYFEAYLFTTPHLEESDILHSLMRITSIYVQVLNQPGEAAEALNRIDKKLKLHINIRKTIRESIEAIKTLPLNVQTNTTSLTFEALNKYVNRYLGGINVGQGIIFSSPGEVIERQWIRGVLFRYLNHSPTESEIPRILYWLALCNLSLGADYDNILANYYIKQCIIHYPKHPYAQHCFTEYEKQLRFFYTTPNETILPFEINNELKELKRHLREK